MLIQPPPPPEQLASGDVRAWKHHRVLIRRGWSGPWTAVDYLECAGFTQTVAPSIPTASFRFLTGRIRREDQDDFVAITPKYFNDWFVRVEIIRERDSDIGQLPGNDPGGQTADTQPLVVWVGVIVDNQVALGGESHGAYADQALTAVGLEYLLDLKTVRGSFLQGGTGQLQEIDTTITFNERLVRGLSEIGNRSAAKLQLDEAHETYVFDGGESATTWTVRDAVEYLLTFFGPAEPEFTLGGQVDALAEIILPRTDLSGHTLHQALVELINPKRGFGWRVTTADSTDEDDNPVTSAEINVFSVTDVQISMGDVTIPANTDVADLDLQNRLDIEAAALDFDSRAGYGRVIVTGERVLSCFSVSFADGTLQKAWSDADQTAYQANAGGDTASESDRIRQNSYPDVYTHFRIHPDWGWQAGNGTGAAARAVNPALKDDGSIDDSGGGGGGQGAFRSWGVDLERVLPLRKPAFASTFNSEWLEPLVITQHGGLYFMLDPVGLVRMLDDELGFVAQVQPAHALAKNHWTAGGADTAFDPDSPPDGQFSVDYTSMIATVAVRTDQQLRVTATVPVTALPGETAADTQARRDQLASRVLHIHVPDAELWYVVPGTVTGVRNGQLVRHSGNAVVRDDVARLRKLAAGALAWYGKIRSTLVVTIKDYVAAHRPGSFVRGITTTTGGVAVNSIVTARQYDLAAGTTTIQTNYSELDFGEQMGIQRKLAVARLGHALVPRI